MRNKLIEVGDGEPSSQRFGLLRAERFELLLSVGLNARGSLGQLNIRCGPLLPLLRNERLKQVA